MTRRAASGAFLASLTRDEGAAYTPRVLGTPETVFIRNRLSGPARHEVIGFHPRVPLWEWLCCMAVAAAVGAMMVSM